MPALTRFLYVLPIPRQHQSQLPNYALFELSDKFSKSTEGFACPVALLFILLKVVQTGGNECVVVLQEDSIRWKPISNLNERVAMEAFRVRRD